MKSTEKLFNVVLMTYNQTPLDFQRNEARCREIIEKTRDLNPDATTIYHFPAFTTTGAECYDAFLRPSVLRRAFKSLKKIARLLPKNSIATFGLPLAYDCRVYCATAFLVGGRIRGFYMATAGFLRGRDAFRQFQPWTEGRTEEFRIAGRVFPIGDLAFREGGVIYEIRSIGKLASSSNLPLDPFFDDDRLEAPKLYGMHSSWKSTDALGDDLFEYPKIVNAGRVTDRTLDMDESNVVLVSNALPFAIDRQKKVRNALRCSSYGNLVVYTTPSGLCSGTAIYDGGSCVAYEGDVLQLKRFQYKDVTFEVEAFSVNVKPGNADEAVVRKSDSNSNAAVEPWEKGELRFFESFARATSCAIFDYMRKSRSKGFALSLSGGADSATIAALIRLGVAFGRRQTSPVAFLRWLAQGETDEDVLRAYPFAKEVLEAANQFEASTSKDDDARDALERKIVGAFLTTVYQATRNSGDITRNAAKAVAEACGAAHYEFNVDDAVEFYKKTVADATGVPWSWAQDDLALQNIQARTRAPGVWLLANRGGRLLLSTGNRSEVACGYATMDGDTAGGLSPIAGIDKAFIRRWLVWLEKTGVDLGESTRLTIPAMKFINEQQPTAELRPQEAKQTDEADLMPYVVLQLFEKALIRDRLELKKALKRVAKQVKKSGIDADDERVRSWGLKFCRLWNASQWKRQRYAPGFSLDDYDLSPCSWARYPILSAGFQFEIDELEQIR